MTSTARRRARKQPADIRREEILDAAIHVFARTPFRAAGTAGIAREAGVAEPTIYRHFTSKRELYLASLERCGTVVADQFRDIAAREANALAALRAMGGWYGDSLARDPDPLRLRHRAIAESDDDEVRQALRDAYARVTAIVADVIVRGQRQGVFHPERDPAGMAWGFIAMGLAIDSVMLMGMPLDECHAHFHDLSVAYLRSLVADPAVIESVPDATAAAGASGRTHA